MGRGTRPRSAAGKALAGAIEARRRKIHRDYAARHPGRAAEERALRLQHRATLADWGHKANGTPETHAQASRTRQGAMARLYQSGTIDAGQLASAAEIAGVVERLTAGVRLRTISLETRIDTSPRHDGAFFEALGQVRREVAYRRWCGLVDAPAAVLAMIAGDCGMTQAARIYRTGKPRLRALLISALDLWPELLGEACKEIDAADLLAMHAGLA